MDECLLQWGSRNESWGSGLCVEAAILGFMPDTTMASTFSLEYAPFPRGSSWVACMGGAVVPCPSLLYPF